MKFFIKSLPVALIALMFNCHKSDSNNNALVVGTWSHKTSTGSGCTDANNNFVTIYGCPATDSYSCDTYTFNANGTFSTTYSEYTGVDTAPATFTESGTFSVHGNQMTATVAGQSGTGTIALSADKKTLTTTFKNTTTGCLITDVYTKM